MTVHQLRPGRDDTPEIIKVAAEVLEILDAINGPLHALICDLRILATYDSYSQAISFATVTHELDMIRLALPQAIPETIADFAEDGA